MIIITLPIDPLIARVDNGLFVFVIGHRERGLHRSVVVV
jgi:hypothetical protein